MADPIASGGGLVPLQSLRHSINVGTHAFRRLGAMSVSSSLDPAAPLVHYESPQSHTAESLPFARSLLASSGVSGWLFLVAPGLSSDASGRSHGLLYARSDAICEAAKAHSAAQKDKAKEEPGVYKKTDLPLTDKLWKFLPVEGSISHVCFNRTSDFLCVCTTMHILLFSLSTLLTGNHDPYAELEMDVPMRDVAWSSSPRNLELGVLLVTGVFRVYQIKTEFRSCVLQCTQQLDGPPATAIVSGGPHPDPAAQGCRAWFLGFGDGSLQMLDTSFPRQPLVFPPHLPPDAQEGGKWGIHSLSYLPLSSDPREEHGRLVVGYSVPQEGDDYGLRDPLRVHVSVLDTDSLEWCDYGDVLRDEEKCNPVDMSDRLFEGRHRFHVSPIPDLRLAVFGSSKAGEVTILGVLPEKSPLLDPIECWSFESATDRIMVPMDGELKDTYALGLAIDTTNRVPPLAPDGPVAAVSGSSIFSSNSASSSPGLFPVVFMLTTNARLHIYHLTTTDATQLTSLRNLMRPAVPVPPLAESIQTELLPAHPAVARPPQQQGGAFQSQGSAFAAAPFGGGLPVQQQQQPVQQTASFVGGFGAPAQQCAGLFGNTPSGIAHQQPNSFAPQQQPSGFAAPQQTAFTGFPVFGQQLQPQQQPSAGLFGTNTFQTQGQQQLFGSGSFDQDQQVHPKGTRWKVPFAPLVETSIITVEGQRQQTRSVCHSLTMQPQFMHKSFEELREEDEAIGTHLPIQYPEQQQQGFPQEQQPAFGFGGGNAFAPQTQQSTGFAAPAFGAGWDPCTPSLGAPSIAGGVGAVSSQSVFGSAGRAGAFSNVQSPFGRVPFLGHDSVSESSKPAGTRFATIARTNAEIPPSAFGLNVTPTAVGPPPVATATGFSFGAASVLGAGFASSAPSFGTPSNVGFGRGFGTPVSVPSVFPVDGAPVASGFAPSPTVGVRGAMGANRAAKAKPSDCKTPANPFAPTLKPAAPGLAVSPPSSPLLGPSCGAAPSFVSAAAPSFGANAVTDTVGASAAPVSFGQSTAGAFSFGAVPSSRQAAATMSFGAASARLPGPDRAASVVLDSDGAFMPSFGAPSASASPAVTSASPFRLLGSAAGVFGGTSTGPITFGAAEAGAAAASSATVIPAVPIFGATFFCASSGVFLSTPNQFGGSPSDVGFKSPSLPDDAQFLRVPVRLVFANASRPIVRVQVRVSKAARVFELRAALCSAVNAGVPPDVAAPLLARRVVLTESSFGNLFTICADPTLVSDLQSHSVLGISAHECPEIDDYLQGAESGGFVPVGIMMQRTKSETGQGKAVAFQDRWTSPHILCFPCHTQLSVRTILQRIHAKLQPHLRGGGAPPGTAPEIQMEAASAPGGAYSVVTMSVGDMCMCSKPSCGGCLLRDHSQRDCASVNPALPPNLDVPFELRSAPFTPTFVVRPTQFEPPTNIRSPVDNTEPSALDAQVKRIWFDKVSSEKEVVHTAVADRPLLPWLPSSQSMSFRLLLCGPSGAALSLPTPRVVKLAVFSSTSARDMRRQLFDQAVPASDGPFGVAGSQCRVRLWLRKPALGESSPEAAVGSPAPVVPPCITMPIYPSTYEAEGKTNSECGCLYPPHPLVLSQAEKRRRTVNPNEPGVRVHPLSPVAPLSDEWRLLDEDDLIHWVAALESTYEDNLASLDLLVESLAAGSSAEDAGAWPRARYLPLAGTGWPTMEIGDLLDVQDILGTWMEGQVRAIKDGGREIFIHYTGYVARWDEWIGKDENRLAARHAHAKPPAPSAWSFGFPLSPPASVSFPSFADTMSRASALPLPSSGTTSVGFVAPAPTSSFGAFSGSQVTSPFALSTARSAPVVSVGKIVSAIAGWDRSATEPLAPDTRLSLPDADPVARTSHALLAHFLRLRAMRVALLKPTALVQPIATGATAQPTFGTEEKSGSLVDLTVLAVPSLRPSVPVSLTVAQSAHALYQFAVRGSALDSALSSELTALSSLDSAVEECAVSWSACETASRRLLAFVLQHLSSADETRMQSLLEQRDQMYETLPGQLDRTLEQLRLKYTALQRRLGEVQHLFDQVRDFDLGFDDDEEEKEEAVLDTWATQLAKSPCYLDAESPEWRACVQRWERWCQTLRSVRQEQQLLLVRESDLAPAAAHGSPPGIALIHRLRSLQRTESKDREALFGSLTVAAARFKTCRYALGLNSRCARSHQLRLLQESLDTITAALSRLALQLDDLTSISSRCQQFLDAHANLGNTTLAYSSHLDRMRGVEEEQIALKKECATVAERMKRLLFVNQGSGREQLQATRTQLQAQCEAKQAEHCSLARDAAFHRTTRLLQSQLYQFPELLVVYPALDPFLSCALGIAHRHVSLADEFPEAKRSQLAGGTRAQVWLAHPADGGQPVVLKRLEPEIRASIRRLRRVVGIMARLRHRNIIELKEIVTDISEASAAIGPNVLLVTPYHGSVDLAAWLQHRRRIASAAAAAGSSSASSSASSSSLPPTPGPSLPSSGALAMSGLAILRDVLSGLAYLHSVVRVVHGDVSTKNVLLAQDDRALLIDFDYSREQQTTEMVGGQSVTQSLSTRVLATPQFVAPELLHGRSLPTAPSDMFAFGQVMREVLHVEFGASLAAPFDAIYAQLTALQPGDRPQARELVHHPCWNLASMRGNSMPSEAAGSAWQAVRYQCEQARRDSAAANSPRPRAELVLHANHNAEEDAEEGDDDNDQCRVDFEQAVHLVNALSSTEMVEPFQFNLRGAVEGAQGSLSAFFYHSVFTQAIKNGYLASSGNSVGGAESLLLLPAPNRCTAADLRVFAALGRLLHKGVCDDQPIACIARFSPLLLRYLLCSDTGVRAFELNDDECAVHRIDSQRYDAAMSSSVLSVAPTARRNPVAAAAAALLVPRRAAMDAMRASFSESQLRGPLSTLRISDLQLLLSGTPPLNATAVVSRLTFAADVRESRVCGLLEQALCSLTPMQLQRLLACLTGLPLLPLMASIGYVRVVPFGAAFRLVRRKRADHRRPVAHLAVRTLEVRLDYASVDELTADLVWLVEQEKSADSDIAADAAALLNAAAPFRTTLCRICYAAPAQWRLSSELCQHLFCGSCANSHVRTVLDGGRFPARCPLCQSEDAQFDALSDDDAHQGHIDESSLLALVAADLLPAALVARFMHRQVVSVLPKDSVVECIACHEFMEIPLHDGDASSTRCPSCRVTFCRRCSVTHAAGENCAQFQQQRGGSDEATLRLLASTTKRCPRCGQATSHYHNHACHHIKPGSGCPSCGHHWCYMCGGDWRPKTCLCPSFCTDACGCPPCPDCKPGRPCGLCDQHGGCLACQPGEEEEEEEGEEQEEE